MPHTSLGFDDDCLAAPRWPAEFSPGLHGRKCHKRRVFLVSDPAQAKLSRASFPLCDDFRQFSDSVLLSGEMFRQASAHLLGRDDAPVEAAPVEAALEYSIVVASCPGSGCGRFSPGDPAARAVRSHGGAARTARARVGKGCAGRAGQGGFSRGDANGGHGRAGPLERLPEARGGRRPV